MVKNEAERLSKATIQNSQIKYTSQPVKKNNPQKQLVINKKDFTAAVASPLMSKKSDNKEKTIEKDANIVGEPNKASQVRRVRQFLNSQKPLEITK